MEDKLIVVVCGYPELYIHLHTFTKTGIHFATRLELPGRSPSHDANLRLLCSEFHARMARIIRVWCERTLRISNKKFAVLRFIEADRSTKKFGYYETVPAVRTHTREFGYYETVPAVRTLTWEFGYYETVSRGANTHAGVRVL